MSDQATPRLSLPYLAAAQAQKHVTVNAAMALLDALVQTAVESRATAVQPGSPADGALYILPASPSGADWSGKAEGGLMRFEAGGWTFIAPQPGALALVKDEGLVVVYAAGAWSPLAASSGDPQNLALLGIGTTADGANPLSVKLNNALFAAKPLGDGGSGDLRLTLSKEASANVLSLLFQDAYSGRAEIGLVGDDALSIKLSADGSIWTTALTLAADGTASFAASLRLAPQATAPGSPQAGHIYFDSGLGKFRGYTGSAWNDLN